MPFGVPDEDVTTEIDATAYLEQKLAAMRAHATQIAVDSPFFTFSDGVGQRAFGREYYTLLAGPAAGGGADRTTGRATCSPRLASLLPWRARPGSGARRAARYDGPAGGGRRLLHAAAAWRAAGLDRLFSVRPGPGVLPVGAVAFAVAIGVTCVLGAWGMRRPLGGLMPAVGWFITSFVLAMGTPGGSVVITNTTAGKWYLFGGAACAAAGVVFGFVRWSPARTGASRRGGSGRAGHGPACSAHRIPVRRSPQRRSSVHGIPVRRSPAHPIPMRHSLARRSPMRGSQICNAAGHRRLAPD